MNYFEIKILIDEKIQGDDLNHVLFFDTPDRQNSYRDIGTLSFCENPPFLIGFFGVNSVVSDIIRPPDITTGLIISPDIKEIIKLTNVDEDIVTFYDMKIVELYNRVYYNYCFLHFIDSKYENLISFEKSLFYSKDIFTKKCEDIIFENYAEYSSYSFDNLDKQVLINRLVFVEGTVLPDFFGVSIGSMRYFVSEKIKNELEKRNIPGVSFNITRICADNGNC